MMTFPHVRHIGRVMQTRSTLTRSFTTLRPTLSLFNSSSSISSIIHQSSSSPSSVQAQTLQAALYTQKQNFQNTGDAQIDHHDIDKQQDETTTTGEGVQELFQRGMELFDMAEQVATNPGKAMNSENISETQLLSLRNERYTQAMHHFRQCIEMDPDHTESLYQLGKMHLLALTDTVDYDTALELLLRAADAGHGKAQTTVAWMYQHSVGTEGGVDTALHWFERCANENDDPHAALAAASILQLREQALLEEEQDQEQKDEEEKLQITSKIFDYVHRAALAGLAPAQYNLGIMYVNGEGTEEDSSLAAQWFTLASEQGHAQATHNLGVLYERGEGVRQDERRAMHLYLNSAQEGLPESMYSIGYLLQQGHGTERDLAKAVAWFERAASSGNDDALYALAVSFEKGVGVERNLDNAMQLYQIAAEHGVADAQTRLAELVKEETMTLQKRAGIKKKSGSKSKKRSIKKAK